MPTCGIKPVIPGIIEALRGATRSKHTKLSASSAMARIFSPGYTCLEYRSHLSRLLGFFEPLERAVTNVIGPTYSAQSLQRSSALREDLRIMGLAEIEIDALDRCQQLPSISVSGLPGYSYVILGSMQGGKIIVDRLRSVLGAGASFQFYGEGIGHADQLWKSYCSDLEKIDDPDVQAICETAVGIFDAYAAWLSDSLSEIGAC